MDAEALVRPVVESAGVGSAAEARQAAAREDQEQGMNQEMMDALRLLEREKGIPFSTLLDGLAEAMASAYKSWRRQQDPDLDEETFGVRAVMDPDTGDLRVWEQELEVDEEGIVSVASEKEVHVTDEFKGRIGAQTAKQVIYQKLRDAE